MIDPTAEDYNEVYKTLRTNFIDNLPYLFVNSAGNITLTTEIIADNQINLSRDFFAGISNDPDKINLILDNITVYTTNPQFSQYLPLRLKFNEVPIVEFANPSVQPITDYKVLGRSDRVVVHKLLNSFEYVEPKVSSLNVEDVPDFTSISDLGGGYLLSYERFSTAFFITNTATSLTTRYIISTLTPAPYVLIKKFESNVMQLTILGPLFSSELFSFTLDNDGAPVLERIIRLDNTPIILGYQVFPNFIYVFTRNGVTGVFDIYYRSDTDEDGIIDWNFANSYEEITLPPPNITNLFDNSFFNFSEAQTGFIARYAVDEVILYRLIFNDANNSFSYLECFRFKTFLNGQLQELWFGSNSLVEPTLNIFISDELDVMWHYFIINNGNKTFKIQTVNQVGLQYPNVEVARYLNQAVFADNLQQMIVVDLDRGSVERIDLSRLYSTTSISPMAVGISGNAVFLIGNVVSTVPIDAVVAVYIPNARTPVNTVYQYSMAYVERTFKYTRNNTFNLSIEINDDSILESGAKSVSTRDLEIFRISIDLRIRYSTVSRKVNESKLLRGDERVTNKGQKSFIKSDRTVGDVDRILGLVSKDFNVSDFLNIYSTR